MKRLQIIAFCLLIFSWGCGHKTVDSTKNMEPPTGGSSLSTDSSIPGDETTLTEKTLGTEGWTSAELGPVYFDYDRSEIRGDQTATLESDAQWMLKHPETKVLIEGHCDERGTEEYNLALGDRRATVTREYMTQRGIAERRMNTVTYGESHPFATGHDEEAWRQNRRAQFLQLAGATQ